MDNMPEPKFEPFLTIKDVCLYLKVSDETLYGWIKHKDIPVHRVGKRWLFDKAELDVWVKSGKAGE